MIENTSFLPNWASPPGETISDFLEDQGLTDSDLARQIDLSADQVRSLLRGAYPLTQNLAYQLADSLGGSSSFWLAREVQYRACLERVAQSELWVKTLPTKDMVNFGWLPRTKSLSEKVAACLEYFDVASVAEWFENYEGAHRLAAFRQSPSFDSNEAAILAWLRKGEIEASQVNCNVWNENEFLAELSSIKKLTREKVPEHFIPILRQACAKHGVALVIAQAPNGCRASGATKFVSQEKALILMSERYLSDDHFWFTFFHEAAHLLLHSDKRLFIEGNEKRHTNEEAEADSFSQDILIPPEHQQEFRDLEVNAKAVIRFARKIGVSPGIVAGQMQHAGSCPRQMLNKLKVRYRKGQLASAANLDSL